MNTEPSLRFLPTATTRVCARLTSIGDGIQRNQSSIRLKGRGQHAARRSLSQIGLEHVHKHFEGAANVRSLGATPTEARVDFLFGGGHPKPTNEGQCPTFSMAVIGSAAFNEWCG
ncbi:MAG: hypothetical protein ACI835_005337 [Planctomycetota bacterium]|jgi:hypothetical protein